MKKVRYMISDAANMMQVESHVLRYWEEELELDVPRNEMGHRYYTEENMQQFRQIKKWKEEGYQLKAIKMMLHNENPNLEEAKQQEHTTTMSGETESEPEKDGQQMHVAVSHTNAAPAGLTKLEQFQLMMNDIVRNAIAENNQALGQAVSEHVGEKVIKEMNYLMQEQEEQEEERFRKLDEAIRSRQMSRKEKKHHAGNAAPERPDREKPNLRRFADRQSLFDGKGSDMRPGAELLRRRIARNRNSAGH